MVRIYFFVFTALAFLGLGSPPARAIENWTVFDLGTPRTYELCMNAGRESMVEYARTFGASRVVMRAGVLYGWGLAKGPHDSVLLCADAGTRATAKLVIYSADNTSAVALTRNIADRFRENLARLTEEWIEESRRRHGL